MPVRNPDPFSDPTAHLKSEVNPFAEELKDESLAILFGDRLRGKAGRWFAWQDHDQRRLCVEIGSYKGKTLVEMAADHPDYQFVGIDITFKRVVTAAKRAQKYSLDNVTTVLAHMNPGSIEKIFAAREIDLLMIFFPDPWSKKKQNKNRIINADFVRSAARILHPTGHVWFKTDDQAYYEIALKALTENCFELCDRLGYLRREYETPFERTFKNKGLQTYEAFLKLK